MRGGLQSEKPYTAIKKTIVTPCLPQRSIKSISVNVIYEQPPSNKNPPESFFDFVVNTMGVFRNYRPLENDPNNF